MDTIADRTYTIERTDPDSIAIIYRDKGIVIYTYNNGIPYAYGYLDANGDKFAHTYLYARSLVNVDAKSNGTAADRDAHSNGDGSANVDAD